MSLRMVRDTRVSFELVEIIVPGGAARLRDTQALEQIPGISYMCDVETMPARDRVAEAQIDAALIAMNVLSPEDVAERQFLERRLPLASDVPMSHHRIRVILADDFRETRMLETLEEDLRAWAKQCAQRQVVLLGVWERDAIAAGFIDPSESRPTRRDEKRFGDNLCNAMRYHEPVEWDDLEELIFEWTDGADEPRFEFVVRLTPCDPEVDRSGLVFGVIEGSHDYTGWDCQSGASLAGRFSTEAEAVRLLCDDARREYEAPR